MKLRRRSRLPVSIQKRLLEHFVAGTPAPSAAELVGVNRNTATLYYRKLREIIAEQITHEASVSGEIEVDESCFGGHRKGKRGRDAAGKMAVFGLLKRHGRVHAIMISNARHQTLMSIIRKKYRRIQSFTEIPKGCYVLSGVSVAEQIDEYCTQTISV